VTVRTWAGRALLAIAVLVIVGIIVGTRQRAAEQPAGSPQPSQGRAAETARSPSPRPSAAATTAATPAVTATMAPVAVLVGAGDIADCGDDGDEATAALLESVDGAVFTLGDNAYEDGTFEEFQECYGPTWGRPSILERTRPVAGNHDYHTHGAAGYFRYFGDLAGSPGEGWYAYDAGAWRIYALNSNCADIGGCRQGSPQERWLRNDLAEHPRRCVMAMWHHPRFSSGDHGDNDVMTDLWRTLQDAGAELMLAGHDHSYERFAPQDAAGRADDAGLIEFVVGTGGRYAYPFRETKPNSLVRETEVLGVLRLELAPDGYSFRFLPVPGDDFTDSGSGACH
jgi:3',5'-cyclic AMP phosphodiesterase CpdA